MKFLCDTFKKLHVRPTGKHLVRFICKSNIIDAKTET